MANANYSVMSSASPNAAGSVNGGINVMFSNGGAALVTPTTSFQFICYSVSIANIDPKLGLHCCI
jgi:alkyl sulfatase BDS1-like metallo-beta-lactamase superfamily hydrolase